MLEKYDKLDEWSIFSSIDSIEQYFVFVDTVLCSVDVDAILKKCTTSRYQEIHYGIVHDNVVPTIQQVAGDPSLKLIEKILLSEMIGVSIYQLDAELESDPPTRRPVYYNHASECDKAKKAKIKNCNFNYQVDKFASYTCAIGMSVGNLIHLVGHVAIEEVAREAERKRDRCIQNARDWWAECIAHAMYD